MKYDLQKREQILVFVGIAVFVFYVFYALLLSPQLAHNQQLKRKIMSQNNQLKILNAKVQTLQVLEQKEEKGQLELMQISDFLTFVSEKAVLAGLDVMSIIPQNEEASGSMSEVLSLGEVGAREKTKELEIGVQMKGTYLGLLEFLHSFEKGIIPAAATGVSLSRDAAEGSLTINVTFTSSFYSGES